MPFQNSWYVAKHVIYTRSWGVVTTDELRDNVADVQRLYDQSDRTMVHQLVDNRAVTQSLNARELSSAMPRKAHPKAGWSIIIGDINPIWRFLADVVMQILRLRYHFAKTPDDAIAFLKSVDKSIDWSKADTSLFSQSAPEREKVH